MPAGQRHETTVAEQLIEHAQGQAFVADTAYDSNELMRQLDERSMQVVICQHPRRKTDRRPLPRELYHKRFRALAARCEKTARPST